MQLVIGTNNGVERQNRLLKECHLRFQTDKSLSGLLKVLHNDFLPEALIKYINENTTASGSYKTFHKSIPVYLRNRPPNIVRHCKRRLDSALSFTHDKINRVDSSSFVVNSSSGKEKYEVYLGDTTRFPKCTCLDFKKHFLPCKHMFAVFDNYADVSWASLPNWFRDSVYVTLDNEIISTKEAKSNENVMEINTDTSVDVDHAPALTRTDVDHVPALTDVEESNKKSDKPMKQTINQIIEMMNILKDTLYDVPSQQALQIAKDKLYLIQQDLNTVCKHEEGIRVQKPDVSVEVEKRNCQNLCV
ncbi:uncharacterized protein LOC144745225 [Ciona intestinalis]